MISFEGVRFTYDGAAPVLDGVDLDVAAGEFVCVLGGNGSGKSTLAKHANALLMPDAGCVRVDGMDTREPESLYAVRATAGMVFQNPDDQIVASLIENDVAFGPENLGLPPDELRRRVTHALAEVGLEGFEKKETAALSGGQKQRVAIAGVLAMEPKVLLLDEASAMLDPRGRSGLLRVCAELHAAGMTVVMITHFMEEAVRADRVVVLEGGRIKLEGAPREVFAHVDELRALNLEVPFAADFSARLRAAGVEVPLEIDEGRLANEVVARWRAAGGAGAQDAQDVGSPAGDRGAAGGAGTSRGARAAEAEAAVDPAAPQPAGAPLITFEHVSYAYDAAAAKRSRASKRARKAPVQAPDWGNSPDAVWALRDVSLSVREGEFLGIAGHTGSGKSTLIQHMNGLLHPTAGRALAGGADLADKRVAREVRGSVGLVLQYPERQLFAATVYDDVAFGPRNLGLPEDEVGRRVRASLERVGLDPDDLSAKSPFELSGGQQRRVAFAGVLAMRPRTLVLDEPAAGLDPAARRDFLDLIARLHAQGMTVVMASHSMDDLARLCSRVAVLKEGELFAVGTPQEMFMRADELRSIGLGVPAAQRMANALRAEGLPLASGVLYDERALAHDLAALLGRSA
ncbi:MULTISPECIES: energy-coupling factor transporter ATPase [unclassified Adlercreutzia]|uniref:energy-coupling factor transporter ATPase n=1 Tax=unclassified Adlercreutzia TaxID=2636013 RepID=UPI0013EC21C2|nr:MULTISPECIES: energy-coupling factor transporter ATPase [unclassified Adlercreutzia]